MGREGSLGSEGPRFESRDCRGRITSIKTKPDSPEVREDGQGLSRAPVFLHMHINDRMTMMKCHYVATICK